MDVLQYRLNDETDTLALGARLAQVLRSGDCVALRGDLGAGKTSLVRGLIQSLVPGAEVPSPTYTLVQIYDLPDYELWHCDLYRLEQPSDAYELGLIDAMDEVVSLIEWPNRLGDLLPETALELSIDFDREGRVAMLSGWEGRDV